MISQEYLYSREDLWISQKSGQSFYAVRLTGNFNLKRGREREGRRKDYISHPGRPIHAALLNKNLAATKFEYQKKKT
jgi:hypothetical protein